jgi:hypothetical protein
MQATTPISREDERLMLGAQLAKLGVRLANRYGQVLECEACKTRWSPERLSDGSLPRGFWRCPNRCNG